MYSFRIDMKKIPKRISNLLIDLQQVFGVQNYDRTYTLEKKNKEHASGGDLAASITIDDEYQRLHIRIYPCFFDNSFENQRQYILHEFCHLLTDDIYDVSFKLLTGVHHTREQTRTANEKSVSKTMNIIEALLLGKMSYAREAYKAYLKPRKK